MGKDFVTICQQILLSDCIAPTDFLKALIHDPGQKCIHYLHRDLEIVDIELTGFSGNRSLSVKVEP